MSRPKLSQKEFEARVLSLYGTDIDVSLAEYNGSFNKVLLICNLGHGTFEKDPCSLFGGYGCPQCAKLNALRFKTEDDVLLAFKNKHGDKFNYVFKNSDGYKTHDYVTVVCPIHGVKEQTIQGHLSHGCFKCAADIKNKKRSLTIVDFKERAVKIHGNRYIYDLVNYVNIREEVKIVCKTHGIFLQQPFVHLNGGGCRLCGNEHSARVRLKSTDAIVAEANHIHHNKYDYSKFENKGVNTKGIVICKKCGYEFLITPYSHISRKCGCPKCHIFYHEDLCRQILFEIYSVEFKSVRPKTLVNSKGRRLELDCYNEQLKINIEYDGIQHYKYPNRLHKNKEEFDRQRQNDLKKDQWCIDNGIINIRVSYLYDSKEKIKDFIIQKLIDAGKYIDMAA